jgi:hypothetical protein
MTPSTQQLTAILAAVQHVSARDAELRRLRGEDFNLFSILGLETAENKTHSAFLGALLNPRGSHGLGAALLQAFLDTVVHQGSFNAEKATLTLEKHIGFRDDLAKTGGRIDIYLHDGTHSIAIENKLYAGDQYAQLERYANHNKDKNTVYYLNLDGSAPSVESQGELVAGQGFHPINYRDDILRWLTACMRLATEQPILRESIKQYRILIQKLTGQMSDSKMNTEIHDLIAQNYTAAKLLAQNLTVVEERAVHGFLTSVKERLEAVLRPDEDWHLHVDPSMLEGSSGISITHTAWDGIFVKLQGSPRLIGGTSIYGIVAHNATWERDKVMARLEKIKDKIALDEFKQSAWWPCWKWINLFSTPEDIAKLFDSGQRTELLDQVAGYLLTLATACREPMAGIERISQI